MHRYNWIQNEAMVNTQIKYKIIAILNTSRCNSMEAMVNTQIQCKIKFSGVFVTISKYNNAISRPKSRQGWHNIYKMASEVMHIQWKKVDK